jgi:hypothetical protein
VKDSLLLISFYSFILVTAAAPNLDFITFHVRFFRHDCLQRTPNSPFTAITVKRTTWAVNDNHSIDFHSAVFSGFTTQIGYTHDLKVIQKIPKLFTRNLRIVFETKELD